MIDVVALGPDWRDEARRRFRGVFAGFDADRTVPILTHFDADRHDGHVEATDGALRPERWTAFVTHLNFPEEALA